MRLPPANASYLTLVRYARYVVTRLRRAKLDVLAATVEAATAKVKSAGRTADDAMEPFYDALADRDAADDALDGNAQQFRLQLAAKAVDAHTKPPYTLIFPDGIGYYIAAPVDAQVARYSELLARMQANLADTDPLRGAFSPSIEQGIAAYATCAKLLDEKRITAAVARTARDGACEEWFFALEKVYGAAVVERGRKVAERFFPQARSVSPAAVSDETETAADAGGDI